ncbi:H-NS histone family protein [Caballeronia arationis]|uniref:H-NS histone family protein n=1 Tax=Caballeronia arationis TaxID=1777142 RepID=A0A7Z7I5B6_9BURK|nr:H-NS histone family protein [Caballeronia arationis]
MAVLFAWNTHLNPKTGETWSGHARPPAWIRDVKDRTKFLSSEHRIGVGFLSDMRHI